MSVNAENLLWIDLEMTGLDPERCSILQIATLVTDSQLNVVAEGPDLVIRHTEKELETLSEWCRTTFAGPSGLIAKARASDVTNDVAEAKTLDFLRQHLPPNTSPLCGNSVHNDRRFLERWMPELHTFAHYRNIDVSTVKELTRRWYASAWSPPEKGGTHDALTDIRESLAELRYYRRAFFTGGI